MKVKNFIKYLSKTRDMYLVYGGKKELRVTSYSDAIFQTDRNDSCSQLG